jgi:hypothetical protein
MPKAPDSLLLVLYILGFAAEAGGLIVVGLDLLVRRQRAIQARRELIHVGATARKIEIAAPEFKLLPEGFPLDQRIYAVEMATIVLAIWAKAAPEKLYNEWMRDIYIERDLAQEATHDRIDNIKDLTGIADSIVRPTVGFVFVVLGLVVGVVANILSLG